MICVFIPSFDFLRELRLLSYDTRLSFIFRICDDLAWDNARNRLFTVTPLLPPTRIDSINHLTFSRQHAPLEATGRHVCIVWPNDAIREDAPRGCGNAQLLLPNHGSQSCALSV